MKTDVVYGCNPNTGKVKAGRSGFQSHSRLYSQFKGSLGFVRHCLKTKAKHKNTKNRTQVNDGKNKGPDGKGKKVILQTLRSRIQKI